MQTLDQQVKGIIALVLNGQSFYEGEPEFEVPAYVRDAVRAELDRIREEFEQDLWTPVARQLPNPDGGIPLLLSNGDYVCRGYYDDYADGGDPHFETDGEGFRLDDVTHYRALPFPPRR